MKFLQAVIEDTECNEGDTVKFKAVLTGDPTPDVRLTVLFSISS